MTAKIYVKEIGWVLPIFHAHAYYAREVKEGRAIYASTAYGRLKKIMKRNPEFMQFCKNEAVKRQFVIQGKSFFSRFFSQERIEFSRLTTALLQDDDVLSFCIREALRLGHDLS